MSEGFYWGCESVHTAATYLQSIRFAEIRQTLDLVGVHHVEVIAGVLIFLMLQFTKFTAVLLLACLIAFSIFYMWDTWFPELGESLSNTQGEQSPYGAGYGPTYDPPVTPFNSEVTYGYPSSPETPSSHKDARTSAIFPPFGNNDNNDVLPGDHSPAEKRNQMRNYESNMNAGPFQPTSTATLLGFRGVKKGGSGSATPLGYRGSANEIRPHRRPYNNQFEDLRYSRRSGERDPQAFRRMIANEYRAFRTGTATEPYQNHRYSPFEDQRMRRVVSPSPPDDSRSRNRRYAENRSSTSKKTNANEPNERQKTESRDNFLRKLRNNFPGPSGRSGGQSRLDPSGAHGTDNRGAKRRSGMAERNMQWLCKQCLKSFKIISPICIKSIDGFSKTDLVKPALEDPDECDQSGNRCPCKTGGNQSTNSDGPETNDETHCNCDSEAEIPTINSNSSYPYVIEMVNDSSAERLATEKEAKRILSKNPSELKANEVSKKNDAMGKNSASVGKHGKVKSGSSEQYPQVVHTPDKGIDGAQN